MPAPLPVTVTNAPLLDLADLGPFVVGGRTFYSAPVRREGAVVGPSTAGNGWSAYMLYRDHIAYAEPWEIVEVDLQTERIARFPGQTCDSWFLSVMPDGNVYTFPEDARAKPPQGYVARINTRAGKLEIFGPGSPDSWNYCHSWGPDRALYLGGYRQQRALRFDPDAGTFTDYGPQAPEKVVEGIYHVAADERYVYSTMGGDPYFLVACNRATRERQVLLRLAWPQRAVLVRRPAGVFVIVDIQRDTPRLVLPTAEVVATYRLEDSVLTPVAAVPPEPPLRAEGVPAHLPMPEIHPYSPEAGGDGKATLWYRPPGGDWRAVTFQAGTRPSLISRLGVCGGKIIGCSEDPYSFFVWDPSRGEKACPGGSLGLRTYAFQETAGKVYFVGYAGAPVCAWDPQKPWTHAPPSPLRPALDWRDPAANPRCVAQFERQRRSYDIVPGADGRLYVPCSANVESLPGGLLGWYDPRTGASGGIREGFETHHGYDAEPALAGRYIVVSTRPWPERAVPAARSRLVVYDTQERRVRACVTPLADSSGLHELLEWRPGLVLGRTSHWPAGATRPDEAVSTFYLLEVETGSTRVVLRLQRDTYGRMLRLPDGSVGCLSPQDDRRGSLLLRVEPGSGGTTVLGGTAGLVRDWVRLDRDAYLAVDARLARLALPGSAER